MGRLIAICKNTEKGPQKKPVQTGVLIVGRGLEGDYHAQGGLRQISLLEKELLSELLDQALQVLPGQMGENLTVEGISFSQLPIGSRIRLGRQALLEITMQRTPCKSLMVVDRRLPKMMAGRCGLMARVTESGEIQVGDPVEVIQYGLHIEETENLKTECPSAMEESNGKQTFFR
jgi:MOSC domain-containing protein YiiM